MAIALVNQGAGGLGATGSAVAGTTVTVTLSQAPLVGSMLVAFYSSPNSLPAVSSISGGGVTWVLAKASAVTGADNEIWYGLNSNGTGTSITITANGTITASRVTVVEFSGVALDSALDATNSGSGSDATPLTGAITPQTSYNEVIFASYKGTTVSTGPINSFVSLNTLNASFQNAYLLVPSTSGSYSTGWTMTGANLWNATIASFKAITATAQSSGALNNVSNLSMLNLNNIIK